MDKDTFYKVWRPGQTPHVSEPALTLHNAEMVRFFIESIRLGMRTFTGAPLAIVAYEHKDKLFDQELAEGTYQLQLYAGMVSLHVFYERGALVPDTQEGIIAHALRTAIRSLQEQVL